MCQFARLYPSKVLQELLLADKELETPTLDKIISTTKKLDEYVIGQEPPAQLQSSDLKEGIIAQEVPARIGDIAKTLTTVTRQSASQIEANFICSPVSETN